MIALAIIIISYLVISILENKELNKKNILKNVLPILLCFYNILTTI